MKPIDMWYFRNPPTLWQRFALTVVALGVLMLARHPWRSFWAYRSTPLYNLGAWTLTRWKDAEATLQREGTDS